MGFTKSFCHWYRMRRIAARVDGDRYAKMRNGTYDFSLEGTPKPNSSKNSGAPPVRKLEFASSPSTQCSEDTDLFPEFPYTDNDNDDGETCLWDAAGIDQDIEQSVDSRLPRPTSTVHSLEFEECPEELPPWKAYRFLGFHDSEPSRVYPSPAVADHPPSLESFPPQSPLLFDFENNNLARSNQTSNQATGSGTPLRITSTVSVEGSSEIEVNEGNHSNGDVDLSPAVFAASGSAIIVQPALEDDI